MKLKTLKQGNVYGFCNKKGDVHVNLTLIKEDAEDYLIKKFSKIYMHEVLHQVIEEIVFDDKDIIYVQKGTLNPELYSYGEECVVRKLNNEKMTKRDMEMYL